MAIKLVLFALLLLFAVSAGFEWIDEDAIYIEDGAVTKPVTTLPRTGDPNATTVESAPPPPVTAIPVEIIPGLCVKASECYPILFYSAELSESSDAQRVVDPNLLKFILSTANYCEPSDLPPQDLGRSDVPSDNVYVWCPIRTFPTSKPNALVVKTNHEEGGGSSSTKTTTPKNTVEEEALVKCGPLKAGVHEDDDAKFRVVGGQDAELGQFPWMVALTNKGRTFCSGSLLDERHVLLAAHCVSHLRRKDLKNIRAFIGDHNIRDPTDIDHQERNVSAIIFHANFSMRTVHSDIGMMYLSEPVKFADNVAPICLSEGEIPFDDGSTYGILTGWGQPAEGKPSSDTLMKAHLRIWRNDECAEKYKGKIPGGGISSKMVCAGSIAPTLKDACKGDSGAPLSLVRNGRMEQVGIVSFGIGCGQYPGVFSKIPDYLDWIEKHRMRSSKYFELNKS